MALPEVPLKREKVEIADGVFVEIRQLTQDDVLRIGGLDGDKDAVSVLLIALGTDTPEDEARAWRAVSPHTAAEKIAGAVAELSGLVEGAQKSDGTGPDDG